MKEAKLYSMYGYPGMETWQQLTVAARALRLIISYSVWVWKPGNKSTNSGS